MDVLHVIKIFKILKIIRYDIMILNFNTNKLF